jgi:hypothetical protein
MLPCVGKKAFMNLPGIALQLSVSLALLWQEAFMNLPGIALQQSADTFMNLPNNALTTVATWHSLLAVCRCLGLSGSFRMGKLSCVA